MVVQSDSRKVAQIASMNISIYISYTSTKGVKNILLKFSLKFSLNLCFCDITLCSITKINQEKKKHFVYMYKVFMYVIDIRF